MSSGAHRRVELVESSDPGRLEARLTGGGLLVGLVLGRSSLQGAASGQERIDLALGHFVLIVLVCVGCALFLGRIVMNMTRLSNEKSEQTVADEAAAENAGEPDNAEDSPTFGSEVV